jgi:hypothetical protein
VTQDPDEVVRFWVWLLEIYKFDFEKIKFKNFKKFADPRQRTTI